MRRERTTPDGSPGRTRAAALLIALATSGCARVLGADFDEKRLRADGGTKDDARAACTTELLPASNGEDPDLWFSVRTVDFGDHGNGANEFGVNPAIGVDVPGAGDCTNPPWANPPSPPSTSNDNAYAQAYAKFRELRNFRATSYYVSHRAQPGDFSVMVLVRGYNGERDDEEVEVGFVDGSMGTATNIGDHGDALWDGSDVWHPQLKPSDGGYLPFVTTPGRVRGWTLEAKTLDEQFGMQHFGLLDSFSFRGTLRKLSSGWRIEHASIGGVTSIRTVFFIAGTFPGACVKGVLFEGEAGLKNTMCQFVDFDTDGDTQCDALTAGATFEGESIVAGCPVEFAEQDRCRADSDPQFEHCGE